MKSSILTVALIVVFCVVPIRAPPPTDTPRTSEGGEEPIESELPEREQNFIKTCTEFMQGVEVPPVLDKMLENFRETNGIGKDLGASEFALDRRFQFTITTAIMTEDEMESIAETCKEFVAPFLPKETGEQPKCNLHPLLSHDTDLNWEFREEAKKYSTFDKYLAIATLCLYY